MVYHRGILANEDMLGPTQVVQNPIDPYGKFLLVVGYRRDL